jgi:cysteine-rich repeat protein
VSNTHIYTSTGTFIPTLYVTHPYDANYVISCTRFAALIEPAPVCGNGVIEGGEQCDDGNTANADGCSDVCQVETWDCSWFTGSIGT